MARKKNEILKQYVLQMAKDNPKAVVRETIKKFGVSRATVNTYVADLVKEGLLKAQGKTRNRQYSLEQESLVHETIPINSGVEEDVVWREKVLPKLADERENVIRICQHGFTEMLNNVIDHSGSDKCEILVARDEVDITLLITDFGIGIFEKIRQDFKLHDARQALLELSKGKLTSQASRHSGEGIFFTSRMFDKFMIDSRSLVFVKSRVVGSDEWLVEVEDAAKQTLGTQIYMCLSRKSGVTVQEVFAKYTDDEFRFMRTHVPLKLAKYEGEQLVSRSQARRLLIRVDRFSEVRLDFNGVATIGQAFADEIFRVYQNEHPRIKIVATNTSKEVDQMISHVRANSNLIAAISSSEKPGSSLTSVAANILDVSKGNKDDSSN